MIANALLYYLIVVNILTFAVYGAPQDDAFEVQVWTSYDSVGSDCPHVFDKREIEIPLNRYNVYGLFLQREFPENLTYGIGRYHETSGSLVHDDIIRDTSN